MKRIGFFLTITAIVLLFVEGCGSALIVLYEAARGPDEPMYSEYDSLLGWVNVPSTSIPDLWGRGCGLTINAQGFRGRAPVTPSVAPGQIRILCSGDSFAFGQGVGDLDTWCHLLSEYDPRIETVNLGQPGYGIDQSYLRFLRDASELEHAIHLFTFIGGDLSRLARRSHHGYAKPGLRLEGNRLVVENSPVPRAIPAVGRFFLRVAERLRSVELAGRLARRFTQPGAPTAEPERGSMAPLARSVFREIQRLNDEKNSVAVFVYLPIEPEIAEDGAWRGWVNAAMDTLGYRFVDPTASLRELSPAAAGELFIPSGAAAAGHYSRAGHAWVARVLYEALRDLPPLVDPGAALVPARLFTLPRDEHASQDLPGG